VATLSCGPGGPAAADFPDLGWRLAPTVRSVGAVARRSPEPALWHAAKQMGWGWRNCFDTISQPYRTKLSLIVPGWQTAAGWTTSAPLWFRVGCATRRSGRATDAATRPNDPLRENSPTTGRGARAAAAFVGTSLGVGSCEAVLLEPRIATGSLLTTFDRFRKALVLFVLLDTVSSSWQPWRRT